MPTIQIKIDERDMTEIRRLFQSADKLYNQVAYRAMGKVVAGVKTDTDEAVREIYNLTKTRVMKEIFTTKGDVDAPNFSVSLGKHGDESSKPVPLINFSATMTQKGASVKVLKAGSKKVIPHTFIAVGRNSNKHVFGRAWWWDKSGSPKQGVAKPFKKTFPYAKLPLMYRQPVYNKYGPRLSDVFSKNPRLYDDLKAKAVARMRKEVDYQMGMALKTL